MKFNFKNFIFFICILAGLNVQAQNQAHEPAQPLASPKQADNRISLTPEEAAWLKAHPEISVAVKHGYSPIEFIFE